MQPLLTQEQINYHNALHQKACKLIKGEMHLDGKELPKPNWFSRRRLNKARKLFLKTIEINSAGWNAMMWLGKIEQRSGNQKGALEWFLRAREFEPINTTLAKEASLTASALGDYKMGARIADEAIDNNPDDPALRTNAGLAHLLAGDCELALQRFQAAADLEPTRIMNSQLVSYTEKVISRQLPKPKKESDIISNLNA